MAPEMVFEKEYNYSIDVWALGVLLYELLHSFAPFPAKNLEEMREKIQLGFYELGSNFSKDLKGLIIDLLQFDPDQRPSISNIMNHPWMEKMKKEIKGEVGKIKS
jgi:serine/threonine protein kinase